MIVAVNTWQLTSAFTVVSAMGTRVVKRGKIFQAGEYPDKGVTVTVDNLRAGLGRFKPVDINSEHWHSVFDGKLGELLSVEVEDDGAVFGTVSLPKALVDLLGNDPLPVSIELSKDFVVTGLAFAKFPRVEDAAVFSALGVKQRKATMPNKFKDTLRSIFNKAVDELPEEGAETTPATTTTVVDDAAVKAEKERADKAEAELAELKKSTTEAAVKEQNDKLLAASKAFAVSWMEKRKVLPKGVEALATLYANQVRLDNASTGVFFSAESKVVEGDNVKALIADLEARPAHQWTSETMGEARLKALGADRNEAAEFAMTEDRKKALMEKSSLGRQALKCAK